MILVYIYTHISSVMWSKLFSLIYPYKNTIKLGVATKYIKIIYNV